MLKKRDLKFRIFVSCFCAAGFTAAVLGFAGRSARAAVREQYVEPDYVRYISQGYDLDTVSRKCSYLFTVTDGEEPVRVHMMTVDADRNTLDILEFPPDSLIFADGFTGTLREAYKTSVFEEIFSRAFCLRLSGSMSFEARTLGDCAEMLGVGISADTEALALDKDAYSRGDEISVRDYRRAVAGIINAICERGSYESFSLLMNLIVNRVETDMPIEDLILVAAMIKDLKPSKASIRLACGCPARLGGETVWLLDKSGIADMLNEHFRVKDCEVVEDQLGIPLISAGESYFVSLPERVTDILK